jgi:alpha-glucosidase
MQWDATANAGFAKAGVVPWLPVPPSYTSINVQAEKADPNSLLAWYQSLIRLKKTNPAIGEGGYTMLDVDNASVLSWMCQAPGVLAVVVSVNFTAEPQTVSLSLPGSGRKVRTLLKTPGAPEPVSLGKIQLGAYGVYIGEIQP